jgi:hypothetical protein
VASGVANMSVETGESVFVGVGEEDVVRGVSEGKCFEEILDGLGTTENM